MEVQKRAVVVHRALDRKIIEDVDEWVNGQLVMQRNGALWGHLDRANEIERRTLNMGPEVMLDEGPTFENRAIQYDNVDKMFEDGWELSGFALRHGRC